MCAIVGAYLKCPTESQIETLKEVFRESQIRGKHATGISWIDEKGILRTKKDAVPAEEFEFPDLNNLQTLRMIGHCRYSTSDLKWNQPLNLSDKLSIVHNGVVDQRAPEHWEDHGFPIETANDSELIWRCAVSGEEPLRRFPEASMAVGELWDNGVLRFYRNGKRPLWMTTMLNGYIVTSTEDIALRSGLLDPKPFPSGSVYHRGSFRKITSVQELIPYA